MSRLPATHEEAPPPDADVLIAGGGFCGAACAFHLLRDHPGLRVAIIEPRAVLGAGLAYGTADPALRVNVAATRMTLLPEDETHFDRWLREGGALDDDPEASLPDGRLYPRRAAFGRYVDAMLRAAGPIVHVRARAVAAERVWTGWRVSLDDGTARASRALVIATGHPPPSLPSALAPLSGRQGLVANPWDEAALAAVPTDARVLIVGTGLTGCDVVASLRTRGHRAVLHAVSRRGLLPRPRRPGVIEPHGGFEDPPAASARDLLRRVRATVAAGAASGLAWEGVVDRLRVQGRAVWIALPLAEQRRLLRHLRPFWDVHRYQCAPQIDDLIRRERDAGTLIVRAAALRSVVPDDSEFTVRLDGRHRCETLRVDTIIACTGPGHRGAVAGNPLLAMLAETGDLAADPLGLGIATDGDSRVLDAAGVAQHDLFVAGPLARAAHGELMGLPQVNLQPRAVAASIAALLKRNSTRSRLSSAAARPR